MKPILLFSAMILAIGLPDSAAGQSAPASGYDIVPAEGRHLKIDRDSGAVSLCEEISGRWRCSLIPDDREALEEEISRLRAENERLKAEVATGRQRSFGPEDEKELDEFFAFSDKAFRRFFGMVQDLKRDLETEDRI